jgi:two-component system, LuxR family, sensor kinase FixL
LLVGIRNRHILLLILVMAAIAVCVSGVAITMLYYTATQQQAMRLAETAQSQARFLEAVARFDARFSREDVPGGAFAATLQQIREAHELFKGFGSTGEFTLAKREGQQMVFLLSQRTESSENPDSSLVVPIQGSLAEPMRQALMGHSGTVTGLDYRGVEVLAAYEPVAELNLGIVAKIDLTEIRQPFLQAGLLVILVTLVLVVIGTFFVRGIGNPLVSRLQENEQRLRGILDTAADGIITLDERGIIHSFNQSAEQIFGYRADEMIGQDINALILEPFPYPSASNSTEPDSQAGGAEREMTGLHRNGKKVPLEITVSEVWDQNSRIITSIVRNISERKEALMALHQREEELRLTFENAPAGIYISSLSGQILRANHAFCALLGFSEQELLGRAHGEFIDANDWSKLQLFELQLVNGGLDSYSLDISFIERDGEKIPCKLRSSVILNEQKKPQLCVVHIEDLSEHLKNEQLVSEHRERLAQVTRLSTLGEMAASIAHEINQPLSAIATYASACQRMADQPRLDSSEVSKILGKIRNQALRAGDVIHRLREFIRNRKTHREQVVCDVLINDVLGLAEVDAHFHQVLVSTELERQLPMINVDVVQIQQVILNLLRNAIEAMEQVTESHDRLVRLEVKRHSADFIEILVIDRGVGLPEESADQLFTPFFTSKPMGMGLGLPISRSIVNAHGGQLGYTHNPEGGSIFRFTLPIQGSSNEADDFYH